MVAMSLKDRTEKKALMGLIQECKTRATQVIRELKDLADLSHISNEVVVKFLDVRLISLSGKYVCFDVKIIQKLIFLSAKLYCFDVELFSKILFSLCNSVLF